MGLFKRKPKVLTPQQAEEIYTKDFFDMIMPSTIKFFTVAFRTNRKNFSH